MEKKIFSEDKASPKEPSEPTDAAGWLRKAYIDHDPADGAPMIVYIVVGNTIINTNVAIE